MFRLSFCVISFNHFRLFEFLSDLGLEPEEKCLPYVIICSHRLTSIVGFEVLIIFFNAGVVFWHFFRRCSCWSLTFVQLPFSIFSPVTYGRTGAVLRFQSLSTIAFAFLRGTLENA